MLAPGPPMHRLLDRAAGPRYEFEFEFANQRKLIGSTHVPLFPSSTIGHPGDMCTCIALIEF